MDYIVFDLEFNQGYNSEKVAKSTVDPKCPFEIIQIGAVKLDDNFKRIGSLDILVKPEIYTSLNPFVKELTGLTMTELDKGISFKKMYKQLSEFIKDDSSVLCVWGMVDIKELYRNIEYYDLDTKVLPSQYINIQSYASKSLNCLKGINIGLCNAANMLDIPIEGKLHNAFNDAHYTAEVFKKIYNSEIKSMTYIPHKSTNRLNNQKNKIDYFNLINQFEKMFNKEMTEDEKSIIKLAYNMGKTKQFQIKISPTRKSVK